MSNLDYLEASFSTLTMSIGSSAIMAMGLAPNPTTGEIEKNQEIAAFNIDLLLVLKEKTKNNLTSDEDNFLSNLINDLQMKYVHMKSSQ